MKTRTLFAVALVLCALASSVSCNVFTSAIIETRGLIEYKMHYVLGDRIFDGTGKEVIWRGAGGSYLFHSTDYLTAWEVHIPEIQAMGLNTVRLAFAFPDSSPNPEYGTPSADIIDYNKLDEILDFLNQYDITAILDCHNYLDMYGDFGSQKLIDDWVKLATHYRGDCRIVAYELFNEPYWDTRHRSIQTAEDVITFYANLTKEIRKVDPDHICIWQGWRGYYENKPLDEFADYLEPNVVYTVHRWWTLRKCEFDSWTPEEISYKDMAYLVEMRAKLKVPFWLGEFGSHSPFNPSNPEWLLAEQLLFRCEEQVIGWNLWQGNTAMDKPWDAFLPFFPLEVYNKELIRETFNFPVPKLTDYVVEQHGADKFEPYQIQMWHNNDYVVFKPEIEILVAISVVLSNGTVEIVSEETTRIIEELTIGNEEGTVDHPGDWNTAIYPIGY